jgi:hypothetical protein
MRTIFRRECDECRLFKFARGSNGGKGRVVADPVRMPPRKIPAQQELRRGLPQRTLTGAAISFFILAFEAVSFAVFRHGARHGFVRLSPCFGAQWSLCRPNEATKLNDLS